MQVFEKIHNLQDTIKVLKKSGKIIGFVPTMGALHNGHIKLVEKSVCENDITVVSIFVNPIQFNNKEDLEKYPRTLKDDLTKLSSTGCDIVFVPDEKEMYPEKINEIYNFGHLECLMEGSFRPGHFNGVAIVVKRLFEIVKPNNAYFGEKDYQQLLIIRELVKNYRIPVNVISHPIVREDDGLAMSSRNQRLSHEERSLAPFIFQTLKKAKENSKTMSPIELKYWVINEINAITKFRLEYFEILDAETLNYILDWNEAERIIGFIAVYLGNVRLIDNIFIKNRFF